jgi:hypothetical protein
MPVFTDHHDPEADRPSPYRGCKWTTSTFPGMDVMLIHNAEGQLVGKFAVPSRLATPETEQVMIGWLNDIADPLPAAQRAAHLRLA